MTSISVIDYIGKIKDGVAILLSLNINDSVYQMLFWINKDKKYVLNVDDEILKILEIDNIYDYKNLNDILSQIFKVLPPLDEIFIKFEV